MTGMGQSAKWLRDTGMSAKLRTPELWITRERLGIRISDQMPPPDFFIRTTSAPRFPAIAAEIVASMVSTARRIGSGQRYRNQRSPAPNAFFHGIPPSQF